MDIKRKYWLKLVSAAVVGTMATWAQPSVAQDGMNEEEPIYMDPNAGTEDLQWTYEVPMIKGDKDWAIEDEIRKSIPLPVDETSPDEEEALSQEAGESVVPIEELFDGRKVQSIIDTANTHCLSMSIHIFKRPRGMGIPYEFGLLELNGKIRNAFVISSGRQGHGTISGTTPFKMSVLKVGSLPSPWKRSAKYQNSPMFWGLNISGGFWLHSTPHYGELGRPASMGCVRVTHPTSMEIWDQSVNVCRTSPSIYIYPEGTQAALSAFKQVKALGLDEYVKAKALNAGIRINDNLQAADIQALIEKDLHDAYAVTRGDYVGNGHRRTLTDRLFERFMWVKGQSASPYYPMCGSKNCFDAFGVKRNPAYPTNWPNSL